jgi:hypothetical protein
MTQLSKIRNKTENVVDASTRIIGKYYKHLLSQRLDNLDKMEQLHKNTKYHVTRFEMDLLNTFTALTDIELIIFKIPQKKSPVPDGLY